MTWRISGKHGPGTGKRALINNSSSLEMEGCQLTHLAGGSHAPGYWCRDCRRGTDMLLSSEKKNDPCPDGIVHPINVPVPYHSFPYDSWLNTNQIYPVAVWLDSSHWGCLLCDALRWSFSLIGCQTNMEGSGDLHQRTSCWGQKTNKHPSSSWWCLHARKPVKTTVRRRLEGFGRMPVSVKAAWGQGKVWTGGPPQNIHHQTCFIASILFSFLLHWLVLPGHFRQHFPSHFELKVICWDCLKCG